MTAEEKCEECAVWAKLGSTRKCLEHGESKSVIETLTEYYLWHHKKSVDPNVPRERRIYHDLMADEYRRYIQEKLDEHDALYLDS